jgi:hypothetical protein
MIAYCIVVVFEDTLLCADFALKKLPISFVPSFVILLLSGSLRFPSSESVLL